MTTIRPGHHLTDHPTRRPQSRARRQRAKPIIVVHTAESGTDLTGTDTKAETVADFITHRRTAGSYHLIGDRDTIIPLIPYNREAFGDRTGSNRWAIHISLAMDAHTWPTLSPTHTNEYLDTAVEMAIHAANWLHQEGIGTPAAQRLTKKQSDQDDASGFIAHGDRDPRRRTDPGKHFPWDDFLNLYALKLARQGMPVDLPTPTMTATQQQPHIAAIQEAANRRLPRNGIDTLTTDGVCGPKTATAITRLLGEVF